MADKSRLRTDDHAEEPTESAQASVGRDGTPAPTPAQAQLAWARALEVCRRRFVERRSAAEIQDGLGIRPDYYERCMRWLLRGVIPHVSAGDCQRGFDRSVIALADADLVGIAVIQSVNDHIEGCAQCAAYLRGLRNAAYVFITSEESPATVAYTPYVVPTLHSSQLKSLRATRKRNEGSHHVVYAKPSTGSGPPSKRKRARHAHANSPLIGLGAVAAAAALGVTLVPSQPLSTTDVQHATDDGDRSRAPRGPNLKAGADGTAKSSVKIGLPAAEGREPPAPERLVVAEQQRTSAPAVVRPSDRPEARLPVAVSAPAVDLATHEARITAAKSRLVALQHAAANALTRTSLANGAAPRASDPLELPESVSPASAATALANAELHAGEVPHHRVSTATSAAVPVATISASANPAPAAPVPATSTPALPGSAGSAPAAPADASTQRAAADNPSERARIDMGSAPPDASDHRAVTVAPQADSAIIALRFDEVREMLRTSLAQHAEQLQVLLSGALASAGGEAPTPQDAVSVSPGGEPVVRPASPSEPAPPPAVDAATPLESVQPPSTVPDGHVDAGTEVI